MASEFDLQRLAARQHGLATRVQLIRLGFTRHQIHGRVAAELWRRAAPSVYDVAPASLDSRRALHAAVLAADGLAAYRSAGILRQLIDGAPARPEIIVTGATLPRGLEATVHRSRTIGPKDRSRVDGIATTSVVRTLLDLGWAVDEPTLSLAVSRAIVSRQTTLSRVLAAVDAGRLMGHRGVASLRVVLDRYRVDRQACESKLESLLADAIAKRRMPSHRQHRIVVGGRRCRLDFAWPDQMVFVEVDGLAEHTERSAFDNDRRRQNLLVAIGWLPLRYTWTDLTTRPDEVVAEIIRVLVSRTR
jgi:very-short-patch-repair endonuclease